MADEAVSKQNFHIRKLGTRSVTLYPTNAAIVREISEITLKPGSNEIIIYGLSPSTDESSIKVDGNGSATITDMSVDLVKNPDKYQDIYPSDSEESQEDSDAESPDVVSDTTEIISKKLSALKELIAKDRETQESCVNQLKLLEALMSRISEPSMEDISSGVTLYGDNRKKIFEVRAAAAKSIEILSKQLEQLESERAKLGKLATKKKEKAKKEKEKERIKKVRVKKDKAAARTIQRIERTKFWANSVYRVVLSLDTNSGFTPMSSRRSSIDSMAKPTGDVSNGLSSESCQISLCLSYVTSAAYWSPKFDLNILTPLHSGTITYRAEFCNRTSETWRDAKVILSTSQTSFQGLGGPIPEIQSWHIGLQRLWQNNRESVLYSHQELKSKGRGQMKQTASHSFQPSSRPEHLFGLDESQIKHVYKKNESPALSLPTPFHSNTSLFGAPPVPIARTSLFGSSTTSSSATAFGSNTVAPTLQAAGGLFGASAPSAAPTTSPFAVQSPHGIAIRGGFGTAASSTAETSVPQEESLESEESVWETSGMTATYDIPGVRTIPPGDTKRRHKIANIALKEIQLYYVIVPKLRAAAFLKARITNSSSVALLKGPAGLTVDGSFLGNTQIPRCEVGESFPLPLGIDPGITVVYGRPSVKKNTERGVFSKEDSSVYSRSITLTNTKTTGAPVELLVTDQVPVSDDQRLKVEVLLPRGLHAEGDQVRTGEAVASPGDAAGKGSTRGSVYSLDGVRGMVGKDENFGKAVATVKKAGDVEWNVKLNPGKGVRLVLEYETRFPAGESVVLV